MVTPEWISASDKRKARDDANIVPRFFTVRNFRDLRLQPPGKIRYRITVTPRMILLAPSVMATK